MHELIYFYYQFSCVSCSLPYNWFLIDIPFLGSSRAFNCKVIGNTYQENGNFYFATSLSEGWFCPFGKGTSFSANQFLSFWFYFIMICRILYSMDVTYLSLCRILSKLVQDSLYQHRNYLVSLMLQVKTHSYVGQPD